MRKLILIFTLPVFISGCATMAPWTQLSKTEYINRSKGFKTVIPKEWMRCNFVQDFLITRDGIGLETISVSLQHYDKPLENSKKMFSKEMTPQEYAEVDIDNQQAKKSTTQFELTSNKPVTIAGRDGYCLEYSYTTEDRLKKRSKVYGVAGKKYLYRICYDAALQHYYSTYLEAFEKLVERFELL